LSLREAAPPGRAPAFAVAAAAVAAVAFLPFARGLVSGHAFFFRDLSLHFFPLRQFALDGLRAGELRYWNPYLHEGIPSPFPPVSYPLELLQLLRPDAWGLSLFLALHVPLAGLAFLALARGLGVSAVAAAGGALAYALGGFCLSTLNLYVYLEAMAWAPLLVLAARRAASGSLRDTAVGGAVVALTWSTVGVEVVLQALVIAAVLAWPSADRTRSLLRLGGAFALGLGLSAPTTTVMSGVVAASERGRGFAPEVVLAHSLHPLGLLQVVIGDFYGELGDVANRWWGENFFPRGFPYFLSLYLGAAALALALVGVRHARVFRVRLAVILVVALLVCLGRWGPFAPLVDALPPLRRFRFPSKAFFTVHFSVALLAALGLDALADGRREAWRRLAGIALVAGGLLAAAPLVPRLLAEPTRWFAWGFFPPDYTWPLREQRLAHVLRDAATGGIACLAAAGVALLVLRGRLGPRLASGAVVALLAADLLRAGAGLNATVAPGFYGLSTEMAAQVPRLRDGGRLFVCEPVRGRAYWAGRALRPDSHEAWTFETYRETLTPDFNLPWRVPTALSEDLTSLVPVSATPGERAGCDRFGDLAPRLRTAAVTHVVSLDALDSAELARVAAVAPPRIAPVTVHLYDLVPPGLPRVGLLDAGGLAAGEARLVSESAGELEIAVTARGESTLVVRDGAAPGWRAEVDGAAAALRTVEEHHRGVAVGSGTHRVRLRYRPPGLLAGLGAMAASAAVALLLGWRGRMAP
jgi:hypothetical protein